MLPTKRSAFLVYQSLPSSALIFITLLLDRHNIIKLFPQIESVLKDKVLKVAEPVDNAADEEGNEEEPNSYT